MGPMRKTVPYVAAWFVAGVAAVVVASLGVSMVSRQVTGSRPAPLSAGEITERLTTAEDPGTASTTTTTTTAPVGPTATVDPGAPTTTAGGGSPTTAGGGSGPPGTVPTTTTTAPPPPAPPTTRTYPLVGGTTTLRFSADGVTVVVATPNAGFSVDVNESHDNGVRVEFESDGHRSRVDAWWDGGPQDEVREDD